MQNTKRYIASLVFVGALVSPLAIFAVPQDATVKVRVYDKDHKDYHYWDDKENRAWGRFLEENHRKDHEFAKSEKKEQEEYWNWRHSHPD
jgi:hypothetical protein